MTTDLRSLFTQTPGGPLPRVVPRSRADLARALGDSGFTRGAEIGVWEGGFSEKLCHAVPGLHLLCVDPWRADPSYAGEAKNDTARLAAAYEAARQRLAPFNCTLMRMTSSEAAAQVAERSLDFVYIDGNHRRPFVLADLAAWAPKVRRGGIVAGHDYIEKPSLPFIEVKRAVDDFTRARDIDPWFVLTDDKSPSYFWVVR